METQPSLRRHAPLFGAALALAVGLTAGGFLKAGALFEAAPRPTVSVHSATDDGVITFMTDADGRVPDYVIGADVAVGPAATSYQQIAYSPDEAATSGDWNSAPSMTGDILAMGEPSAVSDTGGAAASVESHAIDASEVAASGATSRTDRTSTTEVTAQSAADRRDGQAALAQAGFTTTP